MRNMYIAGALLLILFGGTLLNIRYLDSFIGELEGHIAQSQECSRAQDFEEAEASLRLAIDRWNSSDGYTHIFIRHSEINSATDAFYELLSDVLEKNADSATGSYEKLMAQLESIKNIEHVTPGSIF